MGLFGGKTKGIDFNRLRRIQEEGTQRAKLAVEGGFTQAAPLLGQFEQRATQLGQDFETGANRRAQEFARGLQQVESPDFLRAQQAKAQELAFRNLPNVLQQTRENLAATGGLSRGAAIRALQAPTLQAQQTAADQGFALQQAAAGRDIARREQALSTIFSTGQGAALERLGIDQDVARTLLSTGRADILQKAMSLAGIEQNRTQGLLDLQLAEDQQSIAQQQARRARTGQLIGLAGSLGGAAIGGFGAGSLTGALVGSSVGGGLGGLASGSPGAAQSGLSNALALAAFRQRKAPSPSAGPIVSDAEFQALLPKR